MQPIMVLRATVHKMAQAEQSLAQQACCADDDDMALASSLTCIQLAAVLETGGPLLSACPHLALQGNVRSELYMGCLPPCVLWSVGSWERRAQKCLASVLVSREL